MRCLQLAFCSALVALLCSKFAHLLFVEQIVQATVDNWNCEPVISRESMSIPIFTNIHLRCSGFQPSVGGLE